MDKVIKILKVPTSPNCKHKFEVGQICQVNSTKAEMLVKLGFAEYVVLEPSVNIEKTDGFVKKTVINKKKY